MKLLAINDPMISRICFKVLLKKKRKKKSRKQQGDRRNETDKILINVQPRDEYMGVFPLWGIFEIFIIKH